MNSPQKSQDYPVSESHSFIRSIINSAAKQSMGKTLPSKSINFEYIKSRLPFNEKQLNTNRTTMSANEEPVSPNNVRLKVLSDKLLSLNQKLKKEVASKESSINKASVNSFSEKVRQSCAAKQIQFNILHEQADLLLEELEEEKRVREEFEFEMANKLYPMPNTDEPMTLEQIGYLAFEREQNARKDVEAKIANIVDEKLLRRKNKLREEEEDQCFSEFQDELSKICDEIEYEKQLADSNTEKMIQKLSQEIGGFHEALHEEIEKRENGQQSLFKMIEDTHVVLMNDIQLKRREREETEESLLKLLEDTCHKMEETTYS